MADVAAPPVPTRFERFAAVSVLVALGSTWPVLDLLAQNAEFFVARRSPKWEIVVLGLLLTLGIPLVAGAVAALPGRLGAWVGDLLIGVAGTSFALLYLRKIPIPWILTTAMALMVGVAVVVAFHRFNPARLFVRYLSPAPLLLVLVFFFATPVGAVLADEGKAVGEPVDATHPVPVVMLVFDEFPVATLIDPRGDLRADRYPNFAALAADATWFRNAATVEQQTEHSVPAMLTGVIPGQSLTPFAGQYPDNLFTALQDDYDLHVHETITQLCPRSLCEPSDTTSTPMARDVGIVAGHVLLPAGLASGLPQIDRSWGDFGAATSNFDVVAAFRRQFDNDPRKPIQALIDDLAPAGDKPPLYFMHAVVPHHPWQFLATGQRYLLNEERAPGSVSPGWGDDEWLVSQAMQRHHIQAQYVDHALGEIIDAMKTAGIYEDAMLIVVADHGITVRPGVPHQRQIEPDTVGSIAEIPLFIKAPGHAGGVIDDRRAETIDIVPTIADVIGADLPWKTDGTSLFGPDPGRTETTVTGPYSKVTFGVTGDEKLEVAALDDKWMPGGDPWALLPPGAPDLRGETPDATTMQSSEMRAGIDHSSWYRAVDTSSDLLPARVTGRIYGNLDHGDHVLAVAINGTIGAMTRTYVEDSFTRFQVMLPPELFTDGDNDIQLFEVTDSGELLRVERTG